MNMQKIRPKLVINDDASTFLFSGDNLGRHELEIYLNKYKSTEVDLLSYCVSFAAGLCYYETSRFEKFCSGFEYSENWNAHRTAKNMRKMREETGGGGGGGGYIEAVFKSLSKRGIPYLASIRMNDCHMSGFGLSTSHCSSRFWMNHNNFRLGENYGYYNGALDYSHIEVRELFYEIICEVVNKFPDIAGIELDFMRSPFLFNPNQGNTMATLVTDLIRKIRLLLNDAGKNNGKKYLLSVNVPNTPELAMICGLDVETWVKEKLVNQLSAGAYLVDIQVPVRRWKKILSPEVTFLVYTNCSQQAGQYLSRENYFAAAANAYGAGASGLYLFNYCCYEELSRMVLRPLEKSFTPSLNLPPTPHLPDIGKVIEGLGELKKIEELATQNKHYQFYMQEKYHRHYPEGPIKVPRVEDSSAVLKFTCYEQWNKVKIVRVLLKLSPVTSDEKIIISINGKKIDPRKLKISFAPRGRDARLHPVKLGPYMQIDIDAEKLLHNGENELYVQLTKVEESLIAMIEISELEIKVNYR